MVSPEVWYLVLSTVGSACTTPILDVAVVRQRNASHSLIETPVPVCYRFTPRLLWSSLCTSARSAVAWCTHALLQNVSKGFDSLSLAESAIEAKSECMIVLVR